MRAVKPQAKATHVSPEILVVILLLLIVRYRLDLLRSLGGQHLELRSIHRIDVVLLDRDFHRDFILVRSVRLDDTEVFADFVRAFCAPRLRVSSEGVLCQGTSPTLTTSCTLQKAYTLHVSVSFIAKSQRRTSRR